MKTSKLQVAQIELMLQTGAWNGIPLSPPEKTVNFDTKLAVFSTKSVLRRNKSTIVDEICFADEIAYGG